MISIITHNGKFHTDDVFACAILKYIFDDINIIRTRDESIINDSDSYIIDVGGEYDGVKKFDHHQK